MESELSRVWKRPSYVGGNPSRAELLVWSYRWHRARKSASKRDYPASPAFVLALNDAAAGKARYDTSTGFGPIFEARGSKHMRWIEKPAACGLRFVGYAEKIRDLRHSGWYSDNGQSEIVSGVVFQLPGRHGKPLFVPGYDNACNGAADAGGPVCLSFADATEGKAPAYVKPQGGWGAYWTWIDNPAEHDGARTAAGIADQLAQWCAESEREYRAAWSAGSRYMELGQEIAENRAAALALLSERRQAATRASGDARPFDAICKAIRDKVDALLHSIAEARAERGKLVDGDYVAEWLPGFNSRDMSLRMAFNEGAESAVFHS